MRILCTAVLATLVGLGSCTDQSSGFSAPAEDFVSNDNDSAGNNSNNNVDPGSGGGENSGNGAGGNESGDNGSPNKSADGLPTIPVEAPGSGGPSGANPVPEPGTMLLFGLGLSGLAVYRRRREEDELDHPGETIA